MLVPPLRAGCGFFLSYAHNLSFIVYTMFRTVLCRPVSNYSVPFLTVPYHTPLFLTVSQYSAPFLTVSYRTALFRTFPSRNIPFRTATVPHHSVTAYYSPVHARLFDLLQIRAPPPPGGGILRCGRDGPGRRPCLDRQQGRLRCVRDSLLPFAVLHHLLDYILFHSGGNDRLITE